MSHALVNSFDQVWPPFALIAGLLMMGRVAATDGLFESVGARLARIPGGGVVMFAALMALVAIVTAVLNLDTSVVFLTPVLIHAARERGVKENAFLYGAIFMSNGASLLLPGSNLTNILVLTTSHVRSHVFAGQMFLPWIASIVVITLVLSIWCWKDLRWRPTGSVTTPPLRWGLGIVGIGLAVVLVLTLSSPALPILVAGVVLIGAQVLITRRLTGNEARRSLNARTLLILMSVALAFGVVARLWHGPAHLMSTLGPWASAGIGAGLANVVNNLPAAVLLSSRPLHHPLTLLIGLDLGPNVFIIGALSSMLWLRIARSEGAHPSIRTFTTIGVVVTSCSMVVALVTLQLVAPRAF
jgi:arsenical pump membrane protein